MRNGESWSLRFCILGSHKVDVGLSVNPDIGCTAQQVVAWSAFLLLSFVSTLCHHFFSCSQVERYQDQTKNGLELRSLCVCGDPKRTKRCVFWVLQTTKLEIPRFLLWISQIRAFFIWGSQTQKYILYESSLQRVVLENQAQRQIEHLIISNFCVGA